MHLKPEPVEQKPVDVIGALSVRVDSDISNGGYLAREKREFVLGLIKVELDGPSHEVTVISTPILTKLAANSYSRFPHHIL